MDLPLRPAANASDDEWFDWVYALEAMTRVEEPEDEPDEEFEVDPAIEQALAEGYAVLKERAIQAADKVLHFTDDELQAVVELASQFDEGNWYHEFGELCLSVSLNKPDFPGRCISLLISREDDQVLVQSACISPVPLKGEERSLYTKPIPVPIFNQSDFSKQYSLFPESESK